MIQATQTSDRRNIEAAILGSMAFLPEAAEFAATELGGPEFSCLDLRLIFRAVGRMVQRGTAIDLLTIADELIRSGDFAAAGGNLVIVEILEAVPHSAHCRFYVEQLQASHQRDCLRRLGERLSDSAADPTEDPSETINAILNDLETLRAGNVQQDELITAADALRDFDNRNDDPAKIVSTGIAELDRTLRGGLRAGQLIVVGGRPGLGKSALMAQLILNAGRHHRPGLIASLEMSASEITGRGLKTIQRQRFAELPVWFSECGDFAKLASLLRLAKRRHSIELACVDYLQLIESPREKNGLREQQIAGMSRALKRLAMELQIPILLGSQLNRESEKRGRPSLADLRESGAIEQDADIVVLIAGDAESDDRELIIAKHRGGPCGVVKATFDRPKFWFSDAQTWVGDL